MPECDDRSSSRPPQLAADETVLAFLLDVRSGKRLELVSDYLAPSVRAHQGAPGAAHRVIERTPDDYAAHVQEMHAATGPWAFEVTRVARTGELVDAEWRQAGRRQLRPPLAGQPVVEHGRARYAVRDGRIHEYWIDVVEHEGRCTPSASACTRADDRS